MATRIKDGMIPYTGGIGIEITEDHVINVLLRALNNLIHVNEDRELYVDLQIPDGVEPDYDFEVGVTTGRILEEDGRPQNATILNWKTTSGDYVRLIYAADDKLYYDPGTGEWRLLATWEMIEDITSDSNTKTFWIEDSQDLTNAQAAYDWYIDGKSPLIIHEGLFGLQMLTLASDQMIGTSHTLIFAGGEEVSKGPTMTTVSAPTIQFQAEDGEVQNIFIQDWRSFSFLDPDATSMVYTTPFIPTIDGHPATKKYVDDGLALKQDKLTAGTNITIDQNNVISATLPSALVYKGNVQTINDLPSSGQTVGDTYFVEGVDGMYSWDGTQWNYVGSTSPSLTNYFNMTINDSDDITEGSVHLFCTTSEKNYWNSKQDALTAGANIQINNNVISATDTTYSAGTGIGITGTTINNTKPFDPENTGSLSQVLKRTSTGYRWANESGAVTSVNGQTGDVTVNEFDPENTGSTGQVLKKTSTGYAWANESGGGGGGTNYTAGDGISISNRVITNTKPFDPSSGGTTGQVLTKTANGYNWQTIAGGEGNVKLFTLSSNSDTTTAEAALSWFNSGKMPILEYEGSFGATSKQGKYFFYPIVDSTSTSTNLIFENIPSSNQYYIDTTNGYTQCKKVHVIFTISGTSVTNISIGESVEAKNSFISPDVDYANLGNVFTPVRDGDPATKKYVDSRNRIGTQAEYDALVNGGQIVQGVIYNIIPS